MARPAAQEGGDALRGEASWHPKENDPAGLGNRGRLTGLKRRGDASTSLLQTSAALAKPREAPVSWLVFAAMEKGSESTSYSGSPWMASQCHSEPSQPSCPYEL